MEKVKLPKDIREAESRIFIFTVREWTAIAVAILMPFLFSEHTVIGRKLLLADIPKFIWYFLNYGISLLAGLIGFIEHKGMNFEVLLVRMIKFQFSEKIKENRNEGGLLNE